MEESQDRIVLYRAYDTVVDANVAKTKLDAYGIPCFLTDENFVNMYPLRNDVFPGVRLFIFEADADRVNEVMQPEVSISTENSVCPNCQSTNIGKRSAGPGTLLKLIVSILTAPLFINTQTNTYSYCNECKNEWI